MQFLKSKLFPGVCVCVCVMSMCVVPLLCPCVVSALE